MTVLSVPEMHCNNCANRIDSALKAADLKYTISLDDKTVSIDGCEGCVAKAVSELDDLGFSATEIK